MNDEFVVELGPTRLSKTNGHDLTIRSPLAHGWTKSDLKLRELIAIRDALTKYIDERIDVLIQGDVVP